MGVRRAPVQTRRRAGWEQSGLASLLAARDFAARSNSSNMARFGDERETAVTVDFSRDVLIKALQALGAEARAHGKVIDIAIYGGSALVLVSNFRVSTKDVDAVAATDEAFVAAAAARVAGTLSLTPGWLNDGVKTWLSPTHDDSKQYYGSFPDEARPGLRVFVPSPEYMLAMKLMAMRIDEASGRKDLQDILNLMRIVGMRSKDEVVDLAAQFYPEARISGKLALSIDSLWREKERHERERADAPAWNAGRNR
jgi:hypothetical protein